MSTSWKGGNVLPNVFSLISLKYINAMFAFTVSSWISFPLYLLTFRELEIFEYYTGGYLGQCSEVADQLRWRTPRPPQKSLEYGIIIICNIIYL